MAFIAMDDAYERRGDRILQPGPSGKKTPVELLADFWSVHMASHSPELAAVAIRVLSAHVTTAAAERNWSVFGQIFSKTRNRLALESAKKIAYIRGNSNVGMKGVDEEVVLSQACLEVEEEEEVVML